MKIILISIGTRGDVEPFLAIAELLKEKGHRTICAFPKQFENLAKESQIEFVPLTPKFIEILNSELAQTTMSSKGSIFKKYGNLIKLYRQSRSVTKTLFEEQFDLIEKEKPERIVFNGKATYPVIWGIENPNKSIQVSPVPCYIHYVKSHPSVGFVRNYGTFLNKLTYSLTNFLLMRTILSTTKGFKKFRKISGRRITKEILTKKMIFTVSPSIFPRPDYWPKNAQVLGYHERYKISNWKASEKLERFLERHDKILFVTFGSMTNLEPAEKTKTIIDVLEQYRIPAIINTARGGLVEPTEYDTDLIHFVSEILYDEIFPKMYAVIHHGGSGTTHIALKHGCTSMIIPHILDQYLWNNLISDLGVGPKGIAIDKITKQKLEPRILDLISNQSYKTKAVQVAEEMIKEDFREELYKTIVG